MHSFIFSFDADSAAYHRATKALLAAIVVVCALFEGFARFGLPRVSKLIERVENERQAAIATRQRSDGNRKNVVFVGNSLLLWAVDLFSLQFRGSGQFRYSRFVMENTQYWDWYFGLRRLFAEGARPDAVALMLGANHWLGNSVEGEFFSYTLLRPADIFLLREKLELDRTSASNYFFASWSAWLGTRSIVRKNFLRLLFPDIELFTRKLAGDRAYPESGVAFQQALLRLRELKAVCEARGVPLVVVLHPTLAKLEPFEPIREAAVAAGVPVVAPVHMEYPRSLYVDGFHLNTVGMQKFTQDLMSPLEKELVAVDQATLAWRKPRENGGSKPVPATGFVTAETRVAQPADDSGGR